MEDLKKLGVVLKEKFGMECFQIHIHKDEGKKDKETGEIKENFHAHMLFDWQDKTKGTMLRLQKIDMSKIQTLVADVLSLERGELKTNSNRERLEAVEYKTQQETLKFEELQKQNADLEQKKNKVGARIERLAEERRINSENTNSGTTRNKALRELIFSSADVFQENSSRLSEYDENDLNRAIEELELEIKRVEMGD
jgi:flagellar motor protein MotB